MKKRLQDVRELLTLVLVCVLPFHAFLVTLGTRLIFGTGHAPWTALALWKEAFLAAMFLIAAWELILTSLEKGYRSVLRVDVLDVLIVLLGIVSIVLAAWLHTSRALLFLGARYDLLPLALFLVLRRVPWSQAFRSHILSLLVWIGVIVAIVGIVSLFLPLAAFVKLGYSDLHSLYLPNQPLAPYQQIGESWLRRVQSTMSGPNQLGIWLSLPLGALLASWESFRWKRVALLLLLIALLLTFSRSAWIAAAAMLLVVLARLLPRIAYRRFLMAGAAACVLIIVGVTVAFPSVFFRLSSTRGHFVRPLQAASLIMQHPFGLGLGSAGPATNRVSETCVFLRPQDDPSWAKSQPSLCVFLGATQVQPKDHACHCPYLPENWYLQIGVELGVLGFALFLALTVLLLQRLWHSGRASNASFAVFLSFLGICIAALFLHAWEDAAVAYTGWLLAALALPVKPERAG